MSSNPFSPQDYQSRKLLSVFDALIFGLDTAVLRLNETLMDITEDEYHWEPMSEAERLRDIPLSAETKRGWRIFLVNGTYTYDYGDRRPDAPAFTTIAWIMNHIATTADMYLYCIRSGKPVGEERYWHDLTIYSNLRELRRDLHPISPKVLTECLNQLERHGFITNYREMQGQVKRSYYTIVEKDEFFAVL